LRFLKASAKHLHAEKVSFEDLAILLPVKCSELFPVSQPRQCQHLVQVGKQHICANSLILLLRPQTLLNEIKTNTEIIEALEKGSLYATVLDNSYVELRKLMAGMHLMLSFFIRQFFNIDKTLSINLLQKTVPISFYRNLGIV
jgi:hypothetical protein